MLDKFIPSVRPVSVTKSSFSRRFLAPLALLLAVALAGADARAAVTFGNSPAAISNQYSGVITFQVAGLTNGETVIISQYLDGNFNGLLDATDFLVHSFRVTDGQSSVIGGVTNLNVPGDLNTATGAITATLNLGGSANSAIVGQYLFKLESPTARFVPVTNLFNITNSAYAQSFTGTVKASGTNVPGAVVILFTGTDQMSVAAAIANAAGSYTVNAPPGTYQLAALKPNYVTDFSVAPTLPLAAGATVSTNLTLQPTTRSISGKLVDAVNTNTPVPGITLFFQSTNSLATIGFADLNGNFTVPVTSSQWKIEVSSDSLPPLGYLRPQNKPQVSTSAKMMAITTARSSTMPSGLSRSS